MKVNEPGKTKIRMRELLALPIVKRATLHSGLVWVLNEKTFDSCNFSADRTLISAYAVPHRGGRRGEEGKDGRRYRSFMSP